MGVLRRMFGNPTKSAEEDRPGPADIIAAVAGAVSKTFSYDQFNQLFKDEVMERGWTTDDALGVWYSLGNLLVAVAAFQKFDDPLTARRFVNAVRLELVKRWDPPDGALRRLSLVTQESERDAFEAFVSVSGGTELFKFFRQYTNRIRGESVPFSKRSSFEDGGRPVDVLIPMLMSDSFVQIGIATKKLLSEIPAGQTLAYMKDGKMTE